MNEPDRKITDPRAASMRARLAMNLVTGQGLKELVKAHKDLRATSGDELRAAGGRMSGAMKRHCRDVRIFLAEPLLEAIGATPTQTVAHHVMTMAFGQSASTADLTKVFAKPGRDAAKKFVEEAELAAAKNLGVIEDFREVYSEYVKKVRGKIYEGK